MTRKRKTEHSIADTTPRMRNAISFLLALTVLVVVMDVTIMNVALESVQIGLDASNAGLQWSINSYMIAFAAFVFTGGVCADRFGRRRTLIAGLLLFGIASAFAAFSGSIGELILWRAVMGVGAAAVPTVTLAIIVNDFPPAERPRAIATWAATGGIAIAVGPLVGGLLLSTFWWGSVFLINAPIVVVAVGLIAWLVSESTIQHNSRFDPLGVLLAAAASAAVVYGIVAGGQRGDWGDVAVLGPILGGLLLIGALVLIEKRMVDPSLDVALFRSARFSAGTAAIALSFFAFMGGIYVLTFYFQTVLGYSALGAGLLMLPMGVGAVITSASCPMLVPRFGPRAVVAGGALTIGAALACYGVFGVGTPLWVLIVVQLIAGLGWGGIMAPATASLMSVVPPGKAGAGQAVAQTLRQFGAALGVAVIGSVLGALYRSSFGTAGAPFPADLQDDASGSIGGTISALRTVGERIDALSDSPLTAGTPAASELDSLMALQEQGPTVVGRAVEAYVSSMHTAMLVAAGAAILAALVAVRWLPARQGPPPGPRPPRPTSSPPTTSTTTPRGKS